VLYRALHSVKQRIGTLTEAKPPPPERPHLEGPVTMDGLVYLYAHEFVKPSPKRPLGSIPRDRAFACQNDLELDCEDFAKQLVYVVLTELYGQHCLQTRVVPRDPTYMPPYPHKQWEMQLRQTAPFPSSPLAESFAVGFEISKQNRARLKKVETLEHEDEYFSLEEILERSLKAMRQEMTFWERGTLCSDLRRYVETALIAQGYLNPPDRDTWLDTVRTKRPTCNATAVAGVEPEAMAQLRRVETFRKMHGSAYAITPEKDEKGQIVDIDPAIISASEDFNAMPVDDVLRATIHEAVVSIKQLEPSGEAGI
jgi:hypothetical protein